MSGLQAPEGTYTPTATFVLPPGPPLTASNVSAATGASPAAAAISGSGSSSKEASLANAQSTASQPATTSAAAQTGTGAAPHPFGGQVQPIISPGGGSGFGSTSSGMKRQVSGTAASTSPVASTRHANGVSATAAQLSADDPTRATALLHISMHAPSVWNGAPVLTPARISVVSVRNTQHAASGASSMSNSIGNLAAGTSTNANAATVSGSDGSQGGSGSDVGDEREVATNAAKSAGGSRFFGFGSTKSTAQTNTVAPGSAPWHPIIEATLATQGIDGAATHVTGGQGGLPGVAALQLLTHLGGSNATTASTPGMSGQGGGATGAPGLNGMPLNQVTPGGGKNLLKPKNNLKQTSSTFITRMQSHADYPKMLTVQRPADAVIERHMFVSRGRLMCWLGETPQGWVKDPIARIIFNSTITAHDVNQWTRSPNRLDVIIGFTSSDLIWLEAVSMRYSRINKGGCISDVPISNVRWVPGSETLFVTTHTDGSCLLLDIGREDCAAGSWAPISGSNLSGYFRRSGEEAREVLANNIIGQMDEETDLVVGAMDGEPEANEHLRRYEPWDPCKEMLTTRPAESGPEANKKWSRLNPVAHWRVARPTNITDIAFSPDHTKLALTSADGCLRLINLLTETLDGTFESYYGALNRVVWSPDAKFLLTAGCDDMIGIWTSGGRLLGRCRGHTSFVTGLAFDPWRWRVEDRTYRFVSVGEDGCILMWDFSSAALHRPRLVAASSTSRRGPGSIRRSQSGSASFLRHQETLHRGNSASGHGHTPGAGMDEFGHFIDEESARGAIYVPAPSRREIAELQPVARFQVGPVTTHDAACNATGAVSPGCTLSALPFGTADAATTSSMASAGDHTTSASRTMASGPITPAPQGTAGTTASAVSASSPAQGGPASSGIGNSTGTADKVVEHGGVSDLLVDVRSRADGFMLVHRSGTLRFLRRPPMPAAGAAQGTKQSRPMQQAAL